jgi:hypothetical protein
MPLNVVSTVFHLDPDLHAFPWAGYDNIQMTNLIINDGQCFSQRNGGMPSVAFSLKLHASHAQHKIEQKCVSQLRFDDVDGGAESKDKMHSEPKSKYPL